MTVELIIGAIVVLVILFAVLTYNGLVGTRNQMRNAWGQIDVQLNRRHDLIPNLVNAVQGYMNHERDVLDRVTTARAQAIAAGSNVAQRADAENQLCLLYTSDAADERSSVDLGGRRIIKKKKHTEQKR